MQRHFTPPREKRSGFPSPRGQAPICDFVFRGGTDVAKKLSHGSLVPPKPIGMVAMASPLGENGNYASVAPQKRQTGWGFRGAKGREVGALAYHAGAGAEPQLSPQREEAGRGA